jgi:hypothetical protein
VTRVLAALRAAFGSREGTVAAEPQSAATHARHRAEPSEDAPRRADDHPPAGRHRRAHPATA